MRLIDADALIEQLMKEPKVGRLSFEAVLNAVKNMEPIEERKTGKWVKPLLVTNIDRVRCSECSTMYDWYTQAQYFKFCPNCGAKMGT